MMPFQKERYPANWKEISLRIRERDGWRCRLCGAENGKPHPLTGSKVVLTVMHDPDPDPMNCADDNLKSACQRCHNMTDAPMRQKHAAETRRRKRLKAGQMELLGVDE